MHHSQSVQKDLVKEKILNQLKDEELEIISLTGNKEIYWEESDKEFLFKGEMYDVVKTKTVNGKTMLYCINDKIEKALVDNYNLITKQNSSSDKKGKHSLDNSFNLFVYNEQKNTDPFSIDVLNNFHAFVSPLTQSIDDTISPPPKA